MKSSFVSAAFSVVSSPPSSFTSPTSSSTCSAPSLASTNSTFTLSSIRAAHNLHASGNSRKSHAASPTLRSCHSGVDGQIDLGDISLGDVAPPSQADRQVIRIAVPSKGAILDDTKQLLAEVGINVQIKNPRQYVASLKGLDAEVWLQRPADIVRKVRDGDIDLGFTGYDLVAEHGGNGDAIISVHERLAYGECRLAVGVPMTWTDVSTMADLRARASAQGIRIATKYHNETDRFMRAYGIEQYRVVPMDGALEASTQMGTADMIVDLVSSGTTLRENLLKEVQDGTLLHSSMQLIGNRKRLSDQSDFGHKLRGLTKEVLERIEAHLLGKNNFNIIANIRGSSMVDVSRRLASHDNLRGVDGPTISPVVPSADSDDGMYAISIVVPKERLYSAIQQLRSVGGSGVTVMPVSFIFPQQCLRWENLTRSLGVSAIENSASVPSPSTASAP